MTTAKTRPDPPAPYAWRYLQSGLVRHAVNVQDELVVSACGLVVETFWAWCGTADQLEHNVVKWLPNCRNCEQILD